jgi:hypothetical protein
MRHTNSSNYRILENWGLLAGLICVVPTMAFAQVSFDGGSFNVSVSASINHQSTSTVDDEASDSRSVTIEPGSVNEFADLNVDALFSAPEFRRVAPSLERAVVCRRVARAPVCLLRGSRALIPW